MENTGERLLTEIVNQNAIEHIHRYAFALQYVKNKNVIDIASGEGYGSNILASVANAVIGIDISKEAIEHANNKYKRENLSYIHGSADNIPIESNSIDVVVSFETIEHHYKHQEMMTEIKRILNPNGLLIISSPDKLHYSLIPKYDNKYHVKELFVEEFKNLIVNNFTYSIFLNQKLSYCSLIVPIEKVNFYEFSGDFNMVEKNEGIRNPIYNIAIASQKNIENIFSSSFNGEIILEHINDVHKKLEEKNIIINEILHSKTYWVGKIILAPFLFVKEKLLYFLK